MDAGPIHTSIDLSHVVINGRFLACPETAVNRVARELTIELMALSPTPPQLAIPANAKAEASALGLDHVVVGRRGGIAWEQIDLPRWAKGRRLLSLTNTVPLMGRGHVTVLHDAHVFDTPNSYPRSVATWRRLLSRRAGQQGRQVVALSDHAKSRLLAHQIAPADQIHVVNNGVDHVLRSPGDALVAARLGVTRPYCVAQSNMQPHKNLGILLNAFARQDLSHLTLVLTGNETRQSVTEAGFEVPDNVLFTGYLSDAELRGLYEGAFALCAPSRAEGFGLMPLEAMRLGVPVVASPCGATPEICGDAALYADPDLPADWAAKLLALHDPVLRVDLCHSGRERAGYFTWNRSARHLAALMSDEGVA